MRLKSPLKPVEFAKCEGGNHVVTVSATYRHLNTGGWLTNHYQHNDPNIVNLVLTIFEPMAIVDVIAYWLWRKPFLYRLISHPVSRSVRHRRWFCYFILLLALTWHPKMM